MSKSKAPATKAKAVTVYAVQRVISGSEGAAEGEPERVFASETAARKYAAERTLACRAFMNPFSTPYYLPITGGEKKLIARVTKLGLTPPAKKKSEYYPDWRGWWDRNYANMTQAQRDAIWDALDKLELYTVVKTTLED